MGNDLMVVKAKSRDLTDEVTETLRGKSLAWWRAKVRSYLVHIRELMDRLKNTEQQLEAAVVAGEVIQARLGESVREAATLTAELAEDRRVNQQLEGENLQLRETIGTLDVDTVFERLVAAWDHDIAKLEREAGL